MRLLAVVEGLQPNLARTGLGASLRVLEINFSSFAHTVQVFCIDGLKVGWATRDLDRNHPVLNPVSCWNVHPRGSSSSGSNPSQDLKPKAIGIELVPSMTRGKKR
jgi:hypothetical protein